MTPSKFAIITENDESSWEDITGIQYHFPSRYKEILVSGTQVIYYKGKLRNRDFDNQRLSNDPHYFGSATIDHVKESIHRKGDYYAYLREFKPFLNAVGIKPGDGVSYYEIIPPNRVSNYWRDGVREIDQSTYGQILSAAEIDVAIEQLYHNDLTIAQEGYESEFTEGEKKFRYGSYFERNPTLRRDAIKLHGLSCMGCDFNFEIVYGEHGKGFVHVHHLNPISLQGKSKVNPETDMAVVCPNCHAMIHRKKNVLLSIEELKAMIEKMRQINAVI